LLGRGVIFRRGIEGRPPGLQNTTGQEPGSRRRLADGERKGRSQRKNTQATADIASKSDTKEKERPPFRVVEGDNYHRSP